MPLAIGHAPADPEEVAIERGHSAQNLPTKGAKNGAKQAKWEGQMTGRKRVLPSPLK